MNPIKINVEVSFQEASLQALKNIFTTCIGGAAPVRPTLPPKPEAPKVEEKPAEAPAAAPVPEAPAIDNMTLNAEVKGAQARGVDKAVIRGLFDKYGIGSSRECPNDKRPALLADLKAL